MSKQAQPEQESSKFDNLLSYISDESDHIELKKFKRAAVTKKDISEKLQRLDKLEKNILQEQPPKEKPPASSIQVKKKEVVWL
jgi:hypothetical protein